ncbi:Putative undecaprenyl-diphosphatase ybjG [Serratia fonticola]|uniref:undecaprenyl-diphosphatase n=1 Tax=Serratia fonticola TaxID=47917 RepID=UPI0003FBC556|nr:undecaprenyl-diphosphatase [Serratia fonticola]CAI2029310.1 Putative undecaprenyl-diphosphatase ybjG [Serratia fonticola]
MENVNHQLFLWLNAPESPSPLLLGFATFFAEYFIWVIPVFIGIGWLRSSEHSRKKLLEASVAGLTGLLINVLIGSFWQHPRPFMIGLGQSLIPHVADSSFPSDHLTLLWAVAFSFMMHRRLHTVGLVLALLGGPVAWARIYLGVHFPLDMVGAALVALLSAWLALRLESLYLTPLYNDAQAIHRVLFGKLIQLGWVRQ